MDWNILFLVCLAAGTARALQEQSGPLGPPRTDLHHRVKRGWWFWSTPAPSPVRGGWCSWERSGSCSMTCGGGLQRWTRSCSCPSPNHGGSTCSGSSSDYRSCNTNCCPVHGRWNQWYNVGSCSKTCGDGVQLRRRSCNSPAPSCGGSDCLGSAEDRVHCNIGPCPGCTPPIFQSAILVEGDLHPNYTHQDVITYGCDDGYRFVGASEQEAATITCDAGRWTFIRNCTDINECEEGLSGCDPVRENCTNLVGGVSCHCLPEYSRVEGECQLPVIDGGWSGWKHSGVCSATCGVGMQRYERKCNNPPPKNGGLLCEGLDHKFEECNPQCCPVNGNWSEWVDGPCSTMCGLGVNKRIRTCSNPDPTCGGSPCLGVDEINTECLVAECNPCPQPAAAFFAERPGIEISNDTMDRNTTAGLAFNGSYVEFEHGTRMPYRCQSGYQYDQSVTNIPNLVCMNGVWSGDNKCTDIDECKDNLAGCNPLNSHCSNTNGSYLCPCRDGFLTINGICEDVDECKTQPGPCQQLCRNNFGLYQCYCKDGFDLEADGSTCLSQYKECSTLPDLQGGSSSCHSIEGGPVCNLECDVDKEFTSSVDPSPQICIDGQWSYQQLQVPFPTCEELSEFLLDDEFSFITNESCDPGLNFNDFDSVFEVADDLFEVESLECLPLFRKRATEGRLVFHVVVRKQLPASCNASCVLDESTKNLEALNTTLCSVETNFNIQVKNTTMRITPGCPAKPEDIKHVASKKNCTGDQRLIKGHCSECPPGHHYNGTTKSCDPCVLGYFKKSSGPGECAPCPSGMSTRNRGASECEWPCPPGMYSADGFQPCAPCPIGSYQDEEGTDFCYQCHFGWPTPYPGATSLDQCSCRRGSSWQNCMHVCSCENGGRCTSSGCICPRGWTGINCTQTEKCQATYHVAFLDNYRARTSRFIYFLSGSKASAVSVKMSNEVESVEEEVKPRNYTTFKISPTYMLVAEVTVENDDISEVIGCNVELGSMDAFAALPVSSNLNSKEEYYAVSVGTSSHYVGTLQLEGLVLVVGSANNTLVEILVPVAAHVEVSGTVTKLNQSATHTFVINKLDTILVTSSGDLTGTRVTANKSVTVYSGHECGFIPKNTDVCDHLVEQLPPVRLWGKEYVLTPFLERRSGDLVKIVAARENTEVVTRCINSSSSFGLLPVEVLLTLGVGQSHEFILGATEFCHISASEPVLVTQFSLNKQNENIGGPFMLLVPDSNKPVENVSFISIDTEQHRFYHFISFVVKADSWELALERIYLDDKVVRLVDTAYQVLEFGRDLSFISVRLSVNHGYHYVSHGNYGKLFALLVYGFARDVSYGYSLGYHQALSCFEVQG